MGGEQVKIWLRKRGELLLLGLPLKSQLPNSRLGRSTILGPWFITPTAKDTNNDAFAFHSAPLALTATITMDRQRRLSPLSVWVDSGLRRWLDFYGDDHVLFSPSRT